MSDETMMRMNVMAVNTQQRENRPTEQKQQRKSMSSMHTSKRTQAVEFWQYQHMLFGFAFGLLYTFRLCVYNLLSSDFQLLIHHSDFVYDVERRVSFD